MDMFDELFDVSPKMDNIDAGKVLQFLMLMLS